MSEYVILTDSACDIHDEILAEWGVDYASLSFTFKGNEKQYKNNEMPIGEFYAKMREGGVAKTAALNASDHTQLFERYLSLGKDILYIGFSSGLSSTYNASRIASSELCGKYPDRKIITVDGLAASAGQGLLVYLAVKNKNEGRAIEENAAFVEKNKLHICHFFTVDDLVYLTRGGRVSPTVAFVGGLLGIKPILHVDDEGHLINIGKVRGRITSIKALADKYTELAVDKKDGVVYISHGDCIEDAKTLAKMISDTHGAKVGIITDVGAVIGAHAGPGTLALFFVGSHR